MTGFLRRNFIWPTAFLLPAAVLLGAYALTGIYPFGGKTLLTIDMANEYVDYFGWYRSLFTGQGSLFYSFGKALGGNMTGLFAVYLASPFNLLLLPFGPQDFDTAVLLLTLLKTGLCGVTGAVYLRRSQKAPAAAAVIFSLCYALTAYNVVYALNLMWLDGVLLLPLVALGVERIAAGGRPWLYLVTLTLALLTDFYIGYMVALFSALFFIYRVLIGAKPLRQRRALCRLTFRFAGASALAGALSAPLVLPALLSLRTSKEHLPLLQKAAVHTAALRGFGFFDLLHKFSLGAFGGTDAAEGLPNVYCGLLVVVLLFLYFWNRCIPVREKLFSALLIGLLLLCFYLNPLNIVWHGFNPPTWFPYRYSFVLCFLLAGMACRAFPRIRGVGRRHVIACCTVLLGLVTGFAFCHYADESTRKLALSAVFTAGYCLVLLAAVSRGKGLAGWPAFLLVPLVCAELTVGSHELMDGLRYETRDSYRASVRSIGAVLQTLEKKDGGFYRTEKTFVRGNDEGDPTFNDSLMFGYNGLSHYSSTDDRSVNRLLGRLGYKNNGNWVWYDRGSTAAADSLLGVKYLLTAGGVEQPYRRAAAAGQAVIYENPYALPVAFAAGSGIGRVKLADDDPFALQNLIFRALDPSAGADCLTALAAPEVTLHDCTVTEEGSVFRYLPGSARREAWVEFRLTAGGGQQLYAWFPASSQAGVTVSVNGQSRGKLFDVYHNGVLPLGGFAAGQKVTLRLTLPAGGAVFGQGRFYTLDVARLKSTAARLRQGGLAVTSSSADRLAGWVRVAGDRRMLFISLPYDSGWAVTVDGRRVRTVRLLGCLTGVPVTAGTHRVAMRYRPPGLPAGCAAGGTGLLLAVCWAIGRRWPRRRE